MNLFILDVDPARAAQMHSDVHVVKMVLETAQMLSTAHRLAGSHTPAMYMPTHQNHPCARWIRERAANYRWAYSLFVHLCDEYTHRYNKRHLCDRKLRTCLSYLPINLRDNAHEMKRDVTGFPLAMPDQYKDYNSAVQSYRNYYNNEKHTLKGKPATWTRRPVPKWFQPVTQCDT